MEMTVLNSGFNTLDVFFLFHKDNSKLLTKRLSQGG